MLLTVNGAGSVAFVAWITTECDMSIASPLFDVCSYLESSICYLGESDNPGLMPVRRQPTHSCCQALVQRTYSCIDPLLPLFINLKVVIEYEVFQYYQCVPSRQHLFHHAGQDRWLHEQQT